MSFTSGLLRYAMAAAAMLYGGLSGFAEPAMAGLIFSHEDAGFRSFRGAGDSPLGRLTVSAPTQISNIAVDVDLDSGGDIKFLIFNAATGALLLESAPKTFVDDGISFKKSDPFDFTLQDGIIYAIGAIADVGGSWFLDFAGNAQGAFTALTGIQNVSSFADPLLNLTPTCCDTGYRLFAGENGAVPEPGTLALLGLGLAGLGATRRLCRGG